MKQKISVTVDENLLIELEKILSDGKFRNKSHVFEYAVKKLIEGENNG